MKKILIFSLNYYPKYVGGAEVAIKEIVERQDKSKYEFHMITLRFDSSLPKYEVIHGIHIHRIGYAEKNSDIKDLNKFLFRVNKYFFQAYGGFSAFRLHTKYKYDGAWSMMPSATGVPLAVLKLLTFGRIKTIITFQEGDPIPHIIKHVLPAYPLFLYAVRSATVVQSISNFLLNWAKDLGFKNYGIVIPNAVDFKQFTRVMGEDEINEVKNKLGKKDGEKWLITTSRLVEKNAVDDVINAVALYNTTSLKLRGTGKKIPELHFAVLGIGPDEDKLKSLAKKLNMEDYIHFVGQVSHPYMAVYLKACDIFIRPSRSEGMGNSFVEAMSMKIPVIATTEGGLSDFIIDNTTAWEVKRDNPEDIVRAIEDIIKNDNDKVKRITDYSYEMVENKYDWDIIGKDMASEVFSKI